MWSDLLVFPIVIFGAIGLNAILQSVGLTNKIIFLASFFLLCHLCFSTLMWFQLRSLQDTFVNKRELALFGAIAVAAVAVATYIVTGLFPITRLPFFFLKYLPGSQYWSELFVVAAPTYVSFVCSRFVAGSMLS